MEASAEVLELLREIRDGQRALLALTKERMEQSQRNHQEWQEVVKQDLVRAREADEVETRQRRRDQRFGAAVFAIISVGGAIFVLCVSMGWIK